MSGAPAAHEVDNDWTREETGPIDPGFALDLLARRLPRAELHTHLAGAFRPSFTRGVPREPGRPDSSHDYLDVGAFFAKHKTFAEAVGSLDAVTRATSRVLEGAIDSGCRHVEVSVNGTEFLGSGLDFGELLLAAGRAFDIVREELGVTGGLIVAMDRDSSLDTAFATLRQAEAARDGGSPVLGIGNDGFPSRALTEFAPAFEAARASGFRTTCHANKAHDIGEALDRIDHAWELQGDPALQARVAARGIPVTMAMSSCLMMLPGRFPTAAAFPFEELRRAGVAVTLNIDDGGMFFTDSAQEYRLAARTYGYDASTLADIGLASLEAAWITEDRPHRLAAWRREADALITDPRAPRTHGEPTE
ncbi:hypothetical protein VD659_14360 [Herbiconiux sp. 11R-BC]|uniref:adenosine deaminase family protein n=1 Tax=Herbiconiux sp. 11R-BC TaxID=3111637 RepID=UPI003C05D80C